MKEYTVMVTQVRTADRTLYVWDWWHGEVLVSPGSTPGVTSLIVAYREAIIWAMNFGPRELRESLHSQRGQFGA